MYLFFPALLETQIKFVAQFMKIFIIDRTVGFTDLANLKWTKFT